MFMRGFDRYANVPQLGGLMLAIMIIKVIIVIALVVGAVYLIKKYHFSNGNALTILNERYAKGEIDEEEYIKRKQILKSK